MAQDSGSKDLSIIVTAHRERILLHRTLRSVLLALETCPAQAEVLVVLDSADTETLRVVDRYRDDERFRRLTISAGDVSEARNAGVQASEGRALALLDGDDLFGPGWLSAAWREWQGSEDSQTLFHPAIALAFGAEWVMARYFSTGTGGLDPFELGDRNLWTTTVVGSREIFERVPFEIPPSRQGFHEDWKWTCDVLAAGFEFAVVPDTCFFYRRRPGSLMEERKAALFDRSELFWDSRARAAAVDTAVRSSPTGPHRSLRALAHVEARARTALLRRPLLRKLAAPARKAASAVLGRLLDLPPWLDLELRRIHQIEPALWPGREVGTAHHYLARGNAEFANAFRAAMAVIPRETTHLLIVPWLRRGGADLEVINYATALVQLGKKPVVLITEDTESPWLERLPAGSTGIELGKVVRAVPALLRAQLLAVLILQVGSEATHVVNSKLAFSSIAQFSAALSSRRLFFSIFSAGTDRGGRMFGFAAEEIPQFAHLARGIVADNVRVTEWMKETFCLQDDLFTVHHHPAPPVRRVAPREQRSTLHVLWAGRMDYERRPDVLVAVIRAAQGRGMQFFVYGSSMLDPVASGRQVNSLPDAEYRGSFASFEELPVEEFDVLLNTSQWDGMPNILLEAASAGIAVVTSDAGGITELFDHERTALVVSPFDDVEGYVEALDRMKDQVLRERLATAASRVVEGRHNWPNFVREVAATPGYASDA